MNVRRDKYLIGIFSLLYGRTPTFSDTCLNTIEPDDEGEQSVAEELSLQESIRNELESYNKQVLNLLKEVLSEFNTTLLRHEGAADFRGSTLPLSGLALPSHAVELQRGGGAGLSPLPLLGLLSSYRFFFPIHPTTSVRAGLYFFFSHSTSVVTELRSPLVSMAWGRGDGYNSPGELTTTMNGLQRVTQAHVPLFDLSYKMLNTFLLQYYVSGRDVVAAEKRRFRKCISHTLNHFLKLSELKRLDLKKERMFAESLSNALSRSLKTISKRRA